MCARLLACPLCSQPRFLSLDALRAGLVGVATRPLACPVCDELLLGIDKLTIHLFGHTIEPLPTTTTTTAGSWAARRPNGAEEEGEVLAVACGEKRTGGAIGSEDAVVEIYAPIDRFAVLQSTTKEAASVAGTNGGGREAPTDTTANQAIFVQNAIPRSEVVCPANSTAPRAIGRSCGPGGYLEASVRRAPARSTPASVGDVDARTERTAGRVQENSANGTDNEGVSYVGSNGTDASVSVEEAADGVGKEPYVKVKKTSWTDRSTNKAPQPPPPPLPKFPPSHTDRLADLVKNARIGPSALGSFRESLGGPAEAAPAPPAPRVLCKSTRTLAPSERTERCPVCGTHFPDKSILLLHKQLVHHAAEPRGGGSEAAAGAGGALAKNHPCQLCAKAFRMRGSLMLHVRVAHQGFRATLKPREIAQPREPEKESPKEVEVIPSNSESEPGYSCPTCGKHFRKEQHVIQHMKIHEGKQWECDVCSKMFTTKYFLKKHKRLHSGEMPYKCTICDKTFTFQQSFHKHRLYHKDDKPHSCATCGRSFKELSTLHNHERIHTGEKPFACETCGKSFRQRVSYLVHRRIHTGVMPYKCTACGKSFRYKVSQRTHKCPQQSTEAEQTESINQNLTELSEINEIQNNCSQEEVMDDLITSEENQYVFVLNDKGEHILKRKIDLENFNEHNVNEKSNTNQNKKNLNDTNEFLKNVWSSESSAQMDYRENNSRIDNIVFEAMKNSNLWEETPNQKTDSPITKDNSSEKLSIKEVHNEFVNNSWNQANEMLYDKDPDQTLANNKRDLFSMVMSPLESEMSSPSTEMEHLRLSSPVNNQENTSEVDNCFPPLNNSNIIQVDHANAEESFSENNLSTLQTINEDSLKELLYSIVDK